MSNKTVSLSRLSDQWVASCAASSDPFVQTAPQWLAGYFEIEEQLPTQYGWRYSDEQAIQKQLEGIKDTREINRIYWTDQVRNVESYSLVTMWRGSELMKPAIRSLNVGELITPAVLGRSLIELSAAFLTNANIIEKTFSDLNFPVNAVVVSQEFEERVIKMSWGTRLGPPEPHLQQTNILTVLQKLTMNPRAADLLNHYEFLCEIAHPNVIGNARFWSHSERTNEDGSETIVAAKTVCNDEITGSLRNAFTLVRDGMRSLLSKLDRLK